MFVMQYALHARAGETGRVHRLYQEWRQLLLAWRPVSMELLANSQEPAAMILEVRFRDEEMAWSAAESAGHSAWYARLVSLAESGLEVEHYTVVEAD